MSNQVPYEMSNQVPYERLMFFKQQIGLDQETQKALMLHAQLLAAHKEKFAAYFEEVFGSIEETKPYLEVQDYPGQLQKIWMRWFGGLFSSEINPSFMDKMWKSGLTHVKFNIDHRFINLSYCLAKIFCREIVEKHVSGEDRTRVHDAIEKTLDFCLLIETDAFITSTYQCDMEVIKGITHQIRNPVMIIGASMMRLKRNGDVSFQSATGTYDTVLAESKRMERMVSDVSIYNEVFHSSSKWSHISMHQELAKSVENCRIRFAVKDLDLQIGYAYRDVSVLGNSEELRLLFQQLLENAFESVDPENPVISIQTSLDPGTPKFALVEIFNTGKLHNSREMQTLFTPFYSTKSTGTGMGLSIARVVVQKIKGNVSLRAVPGGVVCMVTLPRADN